MSDEKPVGADKKITAGVLGILLGALGIHKFILGYTKAGIIMLAITILGSLIAVGPIIMSVIGLIEGITYLTKSDEDFSKIYIEGRKAWF